jgi:hypothetical protein
MFFPFVERMDESLSMEVGKSKRSRSACNSLPEKFGLLKIPSILEIISMTL